MYSIKMRASEDNQHISGAETICEAKDIEQVIAAYFHKGFQHENGDADFLNLKIEKITSPLVQLQALPIIEVQSQTFKQLALDRKITDKAMEQAWQYITNPTCYRGAIILDATTGERLDNFGERGCRVTHFCFQHQSSKSPLNERVRDALSIASIIQSNEGVVGELCVSDDVNYTTGYFADAKGYHRLHNVKMKGSRVGGRIIFVNQKFQLESFLYFCQQQPKRVIY
ncbi:6-carboxyhexanoate--CoA ligase [Staphylococcus chromogenes]|uniref:6-carboxyhexanoate--CoA ligase n=1 Tax=Staphylococcus sp. 11511212 TaxID=2714544 RepID=UPI001402422B|nr:6-carboxyhexanoate--CoA ligase [Staphylococcus sp. 11511212]NHM77663.1 6-carboxyhexanoate--CoA ligase [Staphylococcus sp. 11511212]